MNAAKYISVAILILLNTISVFGQSPSIVYNESDAELLRDAKVLGRKSQTLTLDNYAASAEKIVQYLENHGYPFASVSLQTEWENDTTPLYRMSIDRGRYTKVDSIVLKGNLKLSKSFLWPYLGLRRKAPYSEKTVQEVAEKLNALHFATVIQPPEIAFEDDKTLLYIYLDKRSVNRFDGYIGFEPVSELTGKLAINGELSLALQNVFHIGERMSLEWRSSERYSQYLNVAADFPYLFRTRFGLDGRFRLDKQDTTYLTLNYGFGIPYHFRHDSYLRPYIDVTRSQLLNPSGSNSRPDTSCMGYRKILYGLDLRVTQVDYLYNPSRGFDIGANIAAGRRTLEPGRQYSDAETATMDLVKTSYRITGGVTGYIPVYKQFVLMMRVQAGSMLSGPHYQNEMFKIGGEGQIRGFRENELYASTYLLYTAEFRYLFGRNSDVHAFFDGGVYEQQGYHNYLFDTPFGFGLGVNIGVRSGVFYFEYALPRQMGNKISFKTGKIHFGVKVKF
jgi:outer membrane protein assembly factor BamA